MSVIDSLTLFLADQGIYILTLVLFFLGMYGMIIAKNYMKKLMSMNVMQVAVIYFFLCLAQKEGGTVPIFDPGMTEAIQYVNPLPHALMLTAIVVSLGTTGVAISLMIRIQETYNSLEEEDILKEAARDD